MSFASLGLSEALLRAVSEEGYSTPTPIQLQAIPAVLDGRDLLAGSQTGTGKTAGFVLPILQRLAAAPAVARGSKRPIRALVLAPTRELAAQVEESVRVYGRHMPLTSGVIYGGVNIKPQYELLERGVDLLVATPGRLLDHHGQRTLDLSKVEVLVLDEADRMLDMGFIHDIRKVLAILPKQRQNLLFSATYSDEIRALVKNLLKDPVQVQVTPRNTTVDSVAQRVLEVDVKRKPELLVHLIKEHSWFQVLIFTRTKHGANRLAAQLEKNGVAALPIHGNKSQNARTRALASFKSGELQALVATDIAARGLDIEQLPHVVNFELPNVPEDYVHRIGRTGRAGATGEALSLVAREELALLRDIERVIKRTLKREHIPGFEPGSAPSASFKEAQVGRELQPQRQGRRDGGGRGASRKNPAVRAPQANGARPHGQPTPARQNGQPTSTRTAAARPGGPAPKRDVRDTARAAAPAASRSQRPSQRDLASASGIRANLPPGWK